LNANKENRGISNKKTAMYWALEKFSDGKTVRTFEIKGKRFK
jgi:hypothetical protein